MAKQSSNVVTFIEKVKAQHGIDLNEMNLDIYYDGAERKVMIDITEEEFLTVLNKHLTSYQKLLHEADRSARRLRSFFRGR